MLDDRDLTAAEALDLGAVDVAAHHLVTKMREARSGGEADVSGADDGDASHGPKGYRSARSGLRSARAARPAAATTFTAMRNHASTGGHQAR